MATPKIASTTKVTSGQTISGIAAKAKVSVAAIAAANPNITNLGSLKVGQVVKIPSVDTAVKTAGSTYAGGLTGGKNPFATGSKTSQATLDKLSGAAGLIPGGTKVTGDDGTPPPPPPPPDDEFPAAGTVLSTNSVDNGDGTFTITTTYADGKGGTYTINTQSGTKTDTKTASKMDSIAAISALLSSYGIGDLGNAVVDAVQKGYSADTINLMMQDPKGTDPLAIAFQTRFPANKARLAAGKPVLSAAEYLAAERSYSQVLQSYGVASLATRDKMNAFITNDISATEVADRVGLAVNRVKNADADTKAALALYYPMLNQADIVGAVLDPAEGLPALQRKVQIAEIGGAALAQGLKTVDATGKLTGINIKMGQEALASLGVTREQARAGFQQVAEVTPRGEFLSSISTGEDYNQLQAEQEAFQGLASAKRARTSLTEQEKARFGGSAGTTKGSLASQSRGAF
jgi:LysM repeat protein